jgi:hypothetical protein
MYVLSKAHKDKLCAKNCIKLEEKSSNLQNAIYVLLTVCRKMGKIYGAVLMKVS